MNEWPPGIESRPPAAAARVLLGGPVALVTTFDRGKANVLPVAWHTPLSAQPPLVGIAVAQTRHSADMIRHSEQFALNFPSRVLLHHVQYLGSFSGARIDKLEVTQFETFEATEVEAPLLTGCVAWVECAVQQIIPVGDHLLCIGAVLAVHVDPAAFDERWTVENPEARPLHFLGDHHYATLNGVVEAHTLASGDAPDHALQQLLEEQLELTREAQERRAELLGQLEAEVEAGNVIDLSRLDLDTLAQWEPGQGGIALPPRE